MSQLQIFIIVAAIFAIQTFVQGEDHAGSCPRRLIGLCRCPFRINGTADNETCESDSDCSDQQKCCRIGCCGFKKCISPVVIKKRDEHPGACPATPMGICHCPLIHNNDADPSADNETCQSDSECGPRQKCCRDGCCWYRKCIDPVMNECVRPNEEFKPCGSICFPTCENFRVKPIACPMVCKAGCFCRNGFVRRSSDNACVRRSECFNSKTTTIAADD